MPPAARHDALLEWVIASRCMGVVRPSHPMVGLPTSSWKTPGSSRFGGTRSQQQPSSAWDMICSMKSSFLLTTGQPVRHAAIPTLEKHIAFLRELIVEAGIPLVEIPPPSPEGLSIHRLSESRRLIIHPSASTGSTTPCSDSFTGLWSFG